MRHNSLLHDVTYMLVDEFGLPADTGDGLYGCCAECRRIVFVRDVSEWASTIADVYSRNLPIGTPPSRRDSSNG